MAPKVLVVLTSADKIVRLDKPTGWYLPEFAHPYDAISAVAEVVVASPKGGVSPLDPGSVETFKNDPSSAAFLANKKDIWENTKVLKDFVGRSGEFDALFYPGGHGPMYDLVDDEDSIALIEEFNAAGKPVAAVCHGPIVLANAKTNGKPIVEGRNVTGFTNQEEDMVGLTDAMPFLLETVLTEKGANFSKAAEPWGEHVVVDGNIITGQNPASANAIGAAIVKALKV